MVSSARSDDPRPETDADVVRRIAGARFTCRAYLPDEVPEAKIRSIMETARLTASWCNVQPWQIVIASKESTEKFRRALMAEAQAGGDIQSDLPFPPPYQGIFKQRRQETGYMLYAALGIQREDWERRQAQSAENFRLFGAPHVAIVSTADEIGPYGLVDTGAFIGSFMLAACAEGIATTPQAAVARHSPLVHSHFDIPDGQKIICGISFGYADMGHPANGFRTPRAAADDVMRIV